MPTQEQWRALLMLAGEVCITTPKRRNAHAQSAYVPWSIVERLRKHVAAMGVNLEAARAEMERLEAAQRERRKEEERGQ